MTAANDQFPTAISDLPACDRPDLIELSDGEAFDLRIAPVVKEIGEATVRMLAYNGSIPGPTLKVQQGSEIEVNVINDGDLEATVHWHGLRLENRYDGTHETQEPIQVGGSTRSRVTFPDPGLYWYHPHIREDYGQEMGLYGNVLVVPSDPDYWASGAPRGSPHARRHPDRGRKGRAVQPIRDDAHGDGQVREHAAGSRRTRPRADRIARRGGAPLPDQHRQHARVQGPDARRADEARRGRQRPRRARAVRRRRRARTVRARDPRRAIRSQPDS